MAFESLKGAVARPYNAVNAQLTNTVNSTARPVHNGFDRFLQKALPASITGYLTSATFLAGSFVLVKAAEKIWTPIPTAPQQPTAQTPPPAAPAAAAPGAPGAPAPDAKPAAQPPVATPARPWGIYARNYLAAGGLVALSSAVNFAVVSIWTGGATPLAYLAGATSVAYYNRAALLAQGANACNYVWNKIRPGVQTEVTKLQNTWQLLKTETDAAEGALNNLLGRASDELKAIWAKYLAAQSKADGKVEEIRIQIAGGNRAGNFLFGRATKLQTAEQHRKNLEGVGFHEAEVSAHKENRDLLALVEARQLLEKKKADQTLAYNNLLAAQTALAANKKAEKKEEKEII